MKKLLITLFLLVGVKISNSQPQDSFFINNNPKLTLAESQWVNDNFNTENFDFRNKYIGFLELSPGIYGLGKHISRWNKKALTRIYSDKYRYRLFVLDSSERRSTKGYDALFVIAQKRNKGRLKRLSREKLISESKNRYPQIPSDAGTDTNDVLNNANAFFLNELYKADLYPKTDIDFKEKKVAILNSHCQHNKLEKIKIGDYVEKIKQQLNEDGFSTTEFTYLLTEQQKEETGGYDVIIQYRCKKDLPLKDLIKHLKESSR